MIAQVAIAGIQLEADLIGPNCERPTVRERCGVAQIKVERGTPDAAVVKLQISIRRFGKMLARQQETRLVVNALLKRGLRRGNDSYIGAYRGLRKCEARQHNDKTGDYQFTHGSASKA